MDSYKILFSNRESEKVEFKTAFNEDVIETLVAFSNTNGGTIFIGVTDRAEIKGITIGKESLVNWINEIKNKTSPQLIPDIEIITVEQKNILAMHIIEYPVKPVAIRGRYYKRVNNSNHLMGLDEIANEYIKTINSSWDFYPDSIHNLDSISIEKVKSFISAIEKRTDIKINLPPLEFLVKLEFLRNDKLTYGAFLLFVKDFCSISDVQVGRFKSDSKIIDSISLNSDLFTEVDEIIAFIKKHLMVEFIITGKPEHDERFDYPLDAIREIVVNMVVHRDYRDSSGSIIKIFDNRIEFFNPGKLYGDITIADLLSNNYSSRVRNKLIARAFKEKGIIEKYGSGIKRVFDICRDYGLVPPKFEEALNGFKVTLFKEKINEPVNEPVNEPANEPVNKRQTEIIQYINRNNSVSISELAYRLNVGRETIKRDLKTLKDSNIIKRIGSDKAGHWEVLK